MAESKEISKEKLSLAMKLARIAEEVGTTAKTGTSSGFGDKYNFIEYPVVAGKLRTLFAKYGVLFVPEVKDYAVDEVTSRKGAAGYHYVIKMHMSLYNAEDTSDRIEADWTGEATDYGDKGINKAETSGVKYFLMRMLCVSEKGDADNEPDKRIEPAVKKPQLKASDPPTDKQLGYIAKLMKEQGQSDAVIQVTQRGIKTAGEASKKIKELQS